MSFFYGLFMLKMDGFVNPHDLPISDEHLYNQLQPSLYDVS